MPLPIYPKRYSVEVNFDPDSDRITITRKCEGMSGWELYGLLNILMKEIERQLLIEPADELKVPEG